MSISIPAKAAAVPSFLPAAKAGPVGAGAGVLMTEYLMPMMLPTDPQRKMRMALKLGIDVSWIRAAERVISGKIGGDPDLQGSVQWHLEDEDGETIDEDYAGDKRAVEAYTLIKHPAKYLEDGDKQITVAEHQGQLWEITSRHMGLAGQGYWFLDEMDQLGIPKGILYIRPDRIWPDVDEQGNLTQWILDPKNVMNPRSGMPLKLNEVVQFPIETPSEGFLATGLVESAVLKAQLTQAIDRHLGSMVSSGGRLSGMFAPKGGAVDDDVVWDQMVRDLRNVSEQPDAAKRVQLFRAPMEYTRTQATLQEMAIIDLMTKNRDDLFALWGVPLSQVGGSTPAGLNSGDVRKFDEAALWQNAIVLRLVPMKQRIQRRLLDRWKPLLGWSPKLCLTIPEFDDDSPRYDKVQKAQFISLRNSERRGLLGFDPFGEKVINPNTGNKLDDEIWMPITMQPTPMSTAPEPDENGNVEMPLSAIAQGSVQAPAATGSVRQASPDARPTSGIPQQGPTKPNMGLMAGMGGQTPFGNPTPTARKAKPVKGDEVIPAVLAALRKQWPESELDIVKQGTWTFDPEFPLKKINAARRPIARNPKIVAGAEAVLAIGAPIAPVTIIHTKVVGIKGYEPIDGWHRLLAADHQGLKDVPAYVGEGDAEWTEKMRAFDEDIPTPPDSAADEDDEAVSNKARTNRNDMRQLRATLDANIQPQLRASVALVLDQQKRDVVTRVRTMYDKIKANPHDSTIWWPKPAAWDDAMTNALRPALMGVAQTVNSHIKTVYAPVEGGKALLAPAGAIAHVLKRGAARVAGINETTRQEIANLIVQGIADDLSPAAMGDTIAASSIFDAYRSELIGRTEMMQAYNAASLGSYDELGVAEVEAIDGDGDPECAERDGQTFSLEDASDIEDHPNGTLDWVPVVKGSLLPSMRLRTQKVMASAVALLNEDVQADRIDKLLGALEEDKAKKIVIDTEPFTAALRDLSATVQSMPAPIVHVEAPVVNMPETPRVRMTRKVIRDEVGNIVEVREESN